MKRTDLAYVAGIIDGEGYIGICKRHRKMYSKGYTFQLSVSVCSTDEWLCTWLGFAFGGSVALRFPGNSKHSPSWNWQIRTKQAGQFLKLIVPYLKIKRPQAEIAIKFQEAKVRSAFKSERQWALEEAQSILLKKAHSPNNPAGFVEKEAVDAETNIGRPNKNK